MIGAILLVVLPLSFLFLREQERRIVAAVLQEGGMLSRILAFSAKTVLLMNAGDIDASGIDCREMMLMLGPNADKGLVYADAILLSSSERLRGRVLASIRPVESDFESRIEKGRLPEERIESLLRKGGGRAEPDSGGEYLEIVSVEKLSDGDPFVLGRVAYSRNALLAPVRDLRIAVVGLFIMLLAGTGVIGLVFGTRLARPIESLIAGVGRIESGDLKHEVSPEGGDELGRLASSFNRMAKALDLKVAELEAANYELSRLDTLKNEFLANTSHELKTPLNGIVGLAESLMDGAAGAMNDDARRNLSLISLSGRRLLRLVNDILDIARIKNGEVRLDLREVDVSAVVRLVIALFEPLARKKGIAIEADVEPQCYFVRADEDRLQQILFNLVDNAIKFTDSGRVRISVSGSAGDRMTAIEVSDTGTGIAAEDHERIFEYFAQADGSTSRRYGGTGLGLAIVRYLVELHGGSISLRSSWGEGSVFRVTLPASPAGDDRRASLPSSEAARNFDPIPAFAPEEVLPVPMSSAKKREGVILIVDDEAVNLQVMSNFLGLAGYSLMCSRDGREALRLIGDGEANGDVPDLVLLDIMMPGLTGFEVLERIRVRYSSHELPVIMLTARRNQGDIAAAFSAGANDYIAKPFDREELLSRVASFVELRRSAARHRELAALHRELEMARQIQASIIPAAVPRVAGIKTALRYIPANSVGGDLYDFHSIDEKRIGIMIADVSGHGMAASVVGAMFKMAFALHRSYAGSPAELIAGMNAALCPYTPRHFITAAYLLVDIGAKKVYSSNAGHFPVPLLKRNTGELGFIYSPGRAIGISAASAYAELETPIDPGDRLLLFTDGITECRNRSGDLFGDERFYDLIRRTAHYGPEQCVQAIRDEAAFWAGGEDVFQDDVCLICVDID